MVKVYLEARIKPAELIFIAYVFVTARQQLFGNEHNNKAVSI